jgi:hypothetical protein
MIMPVQNLLPLDPSLGTDHPPVQLSKVSFDCTIPLVGRVDRLAFEAAVVAEPLQIPSNIKILSEKEIIKQTEALIHQSPGRGGT